ncbi:MAG: 16S rRNA (cytosine(1402)-N(4))-methyltransferase RsmH [Candidatus Pacebacteria bacterium]|nr:16S rRNA (cytosine(1402)-N(4))-methyltransferase RsmH [Candidatus Paceibacterota bacterium]MDQ5922653.1 Ribosomal small subunit methyltransferase [Patescibacteria group bacterium]
MIKDTVHKSVLLKETIDGLNLKKGSVVVDATFGGGGHSLEVLRNYEGVEVVALDQDKSTWNRAKDKFKGLKVSFYNENFRNLDKALDKEGVKEVDGIIFDLGLSSDQLEVSLRGFSFMKDEPLMMTMKENPGREDLTAKDIVNSWSEENLAKILRGYGEENFAGRIARAIAEAREEKEIESTFQLVEIIRNVVPAFYRKGKTHFATKTFQAIRMAVNDELRALQEGLEKGVVALKSGGRMSVISFHSGEDRIVKNIFKNLVKEGKIKLINKKPIVPSNIELKDNKRARSAKLRIIEKI